MPKYIEDAINYNDELKKKNIDVKFIDEKEKLGKIKRGRNYKCKKFGKTNLQKVQRNIRYLKIINYYLTENAKQKI